MHKDKLLKLIDRARRVEEDAVETFSKHIQAASDWVAFDKTEKKRVVEILTKLEEESHAHKLALDNLESSIKKESKNDY